MKSIWTEAEVNYLIENHKNFLTKDLAKNLDKTIHIVTKKLKKLNLKPKTIRIQWTDEEIQFVRDNFLTMMVKDIASNLSNKTVDNVKTLMDKLGFDKNQNIRWTEEEENILREKFSNTSDKDLCKLLPGRTAGSIGRYGRSLGLKRDEDYVHIARGENNRLRGRGLTKEKIKEIALQFKTKDEFGRNDPTALGIARENGWVDEVCSHMVNQIFSTPQLILNEYITRLLGPTVYNTRKIVKPYELDIYLPNYAIAFEYNGARYHKSSTSKNRDLKKLKLCKEKGIKLFIIEQNEKKDYLEDIRENLNRLLPEINQYTHLNITEQQILDLGVNYNDVAKYILNLPDIRELCLSYEKFSDFKRDHMRIYDILRRSELLDEYTSHMIKRKTQRWTKEKLIVVISQCTTISQLKKLNSSAYSKCRRKFPELLKDLEDDRWDKTDYICPKSVRKKISIGRKRYLKDPDNRKQLLKNLKQFQPKKDKEQD